MSTKRRRRHSPEQIVRKLRDADAMLSAGQDLAAVLAGAGDQRSDLRSLSQPERRDEGRGSGATQAIGGGEPAPQGGGGRVDARQPHAEAHRRGKLVSPSRKRQAVLELADKFKAPERRACRNTTISL